MLHVNTSSTVSRLCVICNLHQPARLCFVPLVSKVNVLSADYGSPPCWSAALSRALCLIHKQQGTSALSRTESSKPRILCINGSPDVPAQYIATMNAIFSAQVLIARSVLNTHSHCTTFSYCSSGFVLGSLLAVYRGQGCLVVLLSGVYTLELVSVMRPREFGRLVLPLVLLAPMRFIV